MNWRLSTRKRLRSDLMVSSFSLTWNIYRRRKKKEEEEEEEEEVGEHRR